MQRAEALRRLRQALPDLRHEFGVTRAGLFGSVARDEAADGSDVDVLVELDHPLSYFDIVRLEETVSRALGCKADVAPRSALRPSILAAIDADLVPA